MASGMTDIKGLYEMYCDFLSPADEVRALLAESFKTINQIDDETWDMMCEYAKVTNAE